MQPFFEMLQETANIGPHDEDLNIKTKYVSQRISTLWNQIDFSRLFLYLGMNSSIYLCTLYLTSGLRVSIITLNNISKGFYVKKICVPPFRGIFVLAHAISCFLL